MEYVAGPSLSMVLEKHPNGMPLEEVRHWMRGLVDGVTYLHDHGTVHRDLKPANLFLEEGVVKIGDYGLSKAITQSKEPGHSQSVGTCHYMAPEIGTGRYHKPIDIYAIGVILYEMISGRVPFDGESVQEVLMKHLTSRPDLRGLPEPYKTIIGAALAKDPNQRPARAIDLLAPGDGPAAPDLRFIPESGKSAASGADEPKVGDDVVHIRAEEPVFYIGPDTRPPQQSVKQRMGMAALRGIRKIAPPRPPVPPRPRAQARPAAAARQKPVRVANRNVPEPPPAPPAPPVGRARLAELGTSMLVAAGATFVATALSVPGFVAMNGKAPGDPTQLAMIFSMTLLGSWGVLVPSKFWEGRKVCKGTKRLVLLGVGSLVGLVGAGLSLWAHLGIPGRIAGEPAAELFEMGGERLGRNGVLILSMAGYFALAFALSGLWKLPARDRTARFRLAPILTSAVIAGLVSMFVPSRQPWGLLIVALIASVTQVSAPWSREAAAYSRHRAAFGTAKSA
jgi:hypothetical protein